MENVQAIDSRHSLGPIAFIRQMGPAWVVSAVACGPATMASVSLAGARFGYQMLWVVVLSALFAFVAQYMAAKAGIIGGRGIISLVDDAWGPVWSWILTIDALLATWLAAVVLMKALVATTGLITGLTSPWWAVVYAGLIFALVGLGGYRPVEICSKLLVGLVVVSFMITVAMVTPDPSLIFSGLVPRLAGGVEGATMMAGIMGGAVHVTIIAMHTYTVNARKWVRQDLGLALADTMLSLLGAFGVYSVSLFLAAAVVLHPQGLEVKTALDLARPLESVLGPWAHAIFLAGLWGAVISTITPTFLAAGYFVSDKMKWEVSVKDRRFKMVVLAGCMISLVGPFLKGSFLVLLVIMLALGLCGTPLIVAMLLVLLNRKNWAGPYRNGWLLNVLAGLVFLVTTFLALRFLLAKTGLWS